ncbi:hypothetical protein [Thermomonospora umbrina]|uniref:Uncharacterized protein n=1 Tax=Thermomonospora umbrina TaxID=111806 RepID=A0A3D9SQF5_9ACTN|nr:hypothetical protein [Thermomonospora umbrina]REE98206.1 hypothetical protein DFJ69_3690 [Thermomonospora umbrina]
MALPTTEPTVDVTTGHWAEIHEVWARDGLIRVIGAFQGTDTAEGPWRLRLVPEERPVPTSPRSRLGHRIRLWRMARRPIPGPYRVTVRHGRFEAAVPVRDLVLPRPVRSARWHAYLDPGTPGGRALRLGRHLGVPRRARAITYPAQRADAFGARFRVRPSYTADNHLAIGSRRAR